MKKIALFGATGTVGSRVLLEALRRGHEVTAVVRDPARLPDPGSGSGAGALVVVRGDVLDPVSVAAAVAGHDVVVSAFGPGRGDPTDLVTAARALIGAVRSLGTDGPAPRVVVVGGAGTLRTPGGPLVLDEAGVPAAVLALMHAHGAALDFLRGVPVEQVRWTCLSPPAHLAPGKRTGTYRLGSDDLVVDEEGRSRISVEDFAVALVDEVERDAHAGRRFTVAH
ncbi:3-beta hydroxysteroid dehydrogenase [Streptomyces venezuelae]|uniref:3-beta hydroxysteroid dehydrogenase n=1 Tax=Streptomyces venezuelae TaxID=54571 RepID=A0A5P2DG76_STRVZ|nr:NAD(P)H-binding protein [Streptomyces venezuelae]QES53138.1 3-beta hydroxysteroid dehydrogenase [Streptomyces venezuelae]